jgi:Ca2+-binding EF-hand superfamily protein
MACKCWFVLVTVVGVISWSTLHAQGPRPPGGMDPAGDGACGGERGGPRGDHDGAPGPGKSCLVLKFDADGDGVLNEEERAAADDAIEAALVARFDAEPKDGVLSDEERAAACETLRAEKEALKAAEKAKLLEEFDADKDGKLNREENAAARAAKEAALLAEFDADKDGVLSDEERAAAKAARCEAEGLPLLEGCPKPGRPGHGDQGGHPKPFPRHLYPCLVVEFDADGDGKLNEEELAAAKAAKEAELLARFDADGDGVLSEAERDTARQTLKEEQEARRAAEHAALLAKYDADGDGVLSKEERDAAKAAQKAELLAKFDADGDGVLNAEERAAALAARCEAEEMNEEDEDGEAGMVALALSVDFVRGDANLDSLVDISDAVGVLGFLFLGQAAPLCMDAADASDDGIVDISDPVTVLRVLFLGGASLPEPSPLAGEDPTIDDLTCDG